MAKDYSDNINDDINDRGEQRVEFRPDGEGTDMAVNDDGRHDPLGNEGLQAVHWAAVKSHKDWEDLVIFMYARFNEAFDASVHADDIDTAKVEFVCMTASFYEAFAASARADDIDEAKISQMCVDMILYMRDAQGVHPEFNAFMHTAASFYEAFAASARAIGMNELNTCSMWFDFILHMQRIVNRRD
jgi:hypothetical protein